MHLTSIRSKNKETTIKCTVEYRVNIMMARHMVTWLKIDTIGTDDLVNWISDVRFLDSTVDSDRRCKLSYNLYEGMKATQM